MDLLAVPLQDKQWSLDSIGRMLVRQNAGLRAWVEALATDEPSFSVVADAG